MRRGGRINFIGTNGQVVIDKPFRYERSTDYVFHNGHCAVHDGTGKHMGLIDRNGDWVIDPAYDLIVPEDTFWHLTIDGEEAILSFDLDTIMPLGKGSLWISDSLIVATFADHTQSLYSTRGKLITSSMINGVQQLMYDTREVFYPTNKESDDNLGYDDDIFSDNDPSVRKAVATCYRYSAECGWHGLMSPDGHIVTPPSYVRIEAVDKDLYLCESLYGYGVLLNSKGQRVK